MNTLGLLPGNKKIIAKKGLPFVEYYDRIATENKKITNEKKGLYYAKH